MAHAEKCPICEGKGKIHGMNTDGQGMPLHETCHGCNGKGWVEISDYVPDGWLHPWPETAVGDKSVG